jgi:hypothetical protein
MPHAGKSRASKIRCQHTADESSVRAVANMRRSDVGEQCPIPAAMHVYSDCDFSTRVKTTVVSISQHSHSVEPKDLHGPAQILWRTITPLTLASIMFHSELQALQSVQHHNARLALAKTSSFSQSSPSAIRSNRFQHHCHPSSAIVLEYICGSRKGHTEPSAIRHSRRIQE